MNAPVAVSATFATDSAPLNLDVDGNGKYDALTDALMVIRYAYGQTGAALGHWALGEGATRVDATRILDRLNDIRPLLDVDGNGKVDPLTDGLLLSRYFFGLRGSSLIAGVIGLGASRTTSSEIEAYIKSVMP